MNKFEQLLDYIVNEEKEKAEELFHEIVVEKSRDIYEQLIAEETQEDDEVEEASDKDEDESTEEAAESDEDDAVEEAFGMDDEGGEEGGEPAADFDAGAEEDPEMGGEMGGEEGGEETPATKADVQDLEDALDELKAEFERLMAGEEGEEGGEEGDDFGGEEGGEEEEGDEEESGEEEEEGGNPFESRQMTREYRETVGKPYGSGNGISNKTEQGDGKAGPVSSGKGKPTSGASAHNIAQGDKGTEGIKGGEGLVGGVKGEFTKGVEKNISSSSKASMKSGSTLDGKGKAYGSGGASTSETGAGNTKSVVDRKQP